MNERVSYLKGPRGPRPVARVGPFVASLLNGVFGDPLLHIRIPHHKRSLLIDLGEGSKIPARIAHQVTDVLLSHAHADHIAGFLSFLRSRIGEWPLCRVFAPPGIVNNIAGLVSGIHWDRVGHRAPRFEVTELHADRLRRFSVVAGRSGFEPIGETHTTDGILFRDAIMTVKAAVLDHQTPVLAFSLESSATVKVRKDCLIKTQLAPGPWLTELKDSIAAGNHNVSIVLPNGGERSAASLADELLIVEPGEKLVYATDLADTAQNRIELQALAEGAHTFFCEAAFCQTDAEQALRTGHLTAKACGEIAAAANVQRLIPFHFSRRYEAHPLRVYEETRRAFSSTIVPNLDNDDH